jgi:hypothetical protein
MALGGACLVVFVEFVIFVLVYIQAQGWRLGGVGESAVRAIFGSMLWVQDQVGNFETFVLYASGCVQKILCLRVFHSVCIQTNKPHTWRSTRRHSKLPQLADKAIQKCERGKPRDISKIGWACHTNFWFHALGSRPSTVGTFREFRCVRIWMRTKDTVSACFS